MKKCTFLICVLFITGLDSHAVSRSGPRNSKDRGVNAKTVGVKDTHNVVSAVNLDPKNSETAKLVVATDKGVVVKTGTEIDVRNAVSDNQSDVNLVPQGSQTNKMTEVVSKSTSTIPQKKDVGIKTAVEEHVNNTISESQPVDNANSMDLGTVKSVGVTTQKNSIAEKPSDSSGLIASEKAVVKDSAAKESKIVNVVDAAADTDLKSQTKIKDTPIVTTDSTKQATALNSRFVKTRKRVDAAAGKPMLSKTVVEKMSTSLGKGPQVTKFRELIALNETGAALNISTKMIGALLQTPVIQTYNCSPQCSPLWLSALKKIVGKLPPNHPICTTGSYTACLTAGSVCANEPTKIVCCPIACLTPIMPCYQGPPADNMCIPIDVSHWLEKLKAQG